MNPKEARAFLEDARRNLAKKVNETVVRNTFEQYLPKIVPDRPWWVRKHAEGAETHTRFTRDGKDRSGFVDTLIGATLIEYEADLTRSGCLSHAEDQLLDYAAGEINRGVVADHLIAIASDAVRWRAYRVTLDVDRTVDGKIGRTHVKLHLCDEVDFTSSDPLEGERLVTFLVRHLARIGARRLDGRNLADDLGLGTSRSDELRLRLDEIEGTARGLRPGYGELIDRLWSELVDNIGGVASRRLGRAEYLDEFYLMTLAKLICANVVDRRAPLRTDQELAEILGGHFFSRKGLQNYVEYDLFGWLCESPGATGMTEVARVMQADLAAYDFAGVETHDLFGQLLARLGRRSTRLILGQELTPPWLAERLVGKLGADIGEPLRLVDTACGSGTILVEAIRYERTRAIDPASTETREGRAERMAAAATGFDIDPVAALFAKTNWVIAMRDDLDVLGDFSIPVFHADSLFAGLASSDPEQFVLKLDEASVAPPACLLESDGRVVFDHLLTDTYRVAMAEAETKVDAPDTDVAATIARNAIAHAKRPDLFDEEEVTAFSRTLILRLFELQRDGHNGLWTYVIRNTSRAAQAKMQFNAMALNPPWLALSKIGKNPYATNLARLATEFGVRPAGQSFLHAEMSTIFLLEGVRRYLEPGGRFGCIVPSTIAEGHHQNRFRTGRYSTSGRAVDLDVDSIWRVEGSTFRNEAVVAFGSRTPFAGRTELPGRIVGPRRDDEARYESRIARYPGHETRTVWSMVDDAPNRRSEGFGYVPASFRQGADLMPRTIWFHEFDERSAELYDLKSIKAGSRLGYLVKDAKSQKGFQLPNLTIDRNYVAKAVLSNHLIPFHLAPPARLLMPATYDGRQWSGTGRIVLGIGRGATGQAFDAIRATLCQPPDDCLFRILDTMGKLRNQSWSEGDHLVVSGAGGANPCAAWIGPGMAIAGEVVFDQTVYWAAVRSLEEAAYLAGAVNSPACATLIAPFQPKGALGRRHIHKLPFAVTPPFEPSNELHADVARASIALQAAWVERMTEFPMEARLADPGHGSLPSRRRGAMKVIRELPEWDSFVEATDALYGV